MKKAISIFLFSLLLGMSLLTSVHAQDIGLEVNGQSLGQSSGLSGNDIRTTGVQIINVILGFLGIICVSLLVYAGFMWMTSGGSDDKIETAKKIIWATVIGLIIILSAWSITTFVLSRTYNAASGNVVEIY